MKLLLLSLTLLLGALGYESQSAPESAPTPDARCEINCDGGPCTIVSAECLPDGECRIVCEGPEGQTCESIIDCDNPEQCEVLQDCARNACDNVSEALPACAGSSDDKSDATTSGAPAQAGSSCCKK